MTTTPNLPCTAALLMGGRSRRMGYDKAGILVNGVPLWRRQLDILMETGAAEIVVSGSEDRRGMTGDFPLLVDEGAGEGPLRALATILRHTRHDGAIVLGVDLPEMEPAFLRQIAGLGASRGTAVVPQAQDRLQPLAAYYPRSLLPLIDGQISRDELALHRLVSRAAAEGLAFVLPTEREQWHLFVNLNTPEDVSAYRAAGEH